MSADSLPQETSEPSSSPGVARPNVMDEFLELAASRNLKIMLNKALSMIVRLLEAESGSILFKGRTLRLVRSGAFRPEVLARIQYWEKVIGQRLLDTAWRIPDTVALPISTIKLDDSELNLVNVPLISEDRVVVGALSLILPPNRKLTPQKHVQLTRIARGVGHMASVVADLELAQQRLKQMTVFYKVGQALMTTFDVNKLLSDTMRLATEVIDAGAASLMLIDEASEELVFEISLGSRGHILRQQRISLEEGIAGWVARNGQPAIANNARADPRFSHRVDVRTGFLTQSIAAVPLKIKGRVIGVLEVLNKYSETGFDQEDLQLMSTIAAQAAVAIENARLYQQVRQERDHVIKAQEDVRRELNRKLHDGPVQLLAAIDMSLDHLERLSQVNKPEAVRSEIGALRELVRQTTRDARNILFELRPLILETQGLVPAFEQYVNQLRESESFNIHFKTVEEVNFDTRIAGTIFSIVQEALNNIKRHAKARNVWLTLETTNNRFVVTVRDDGVGFDVNRRDNNFDQGVSFGILNMQERAELIEAELQIESSTEPPNRGTTIRLVLPMPQRLAHTNPG